jgi:hypothetical protein
MTNTFKFKPSKLKFTREKKTLDEMHKDTIDKFDENSNLILLKKQKISFINNKIIELNNSDIKDKDLKINSLQQKIKLINNEIADLNALSNELDYFEKTRDILIKYYQHEHKIDSDNINDNLITETSSINTPNEITFKYEVNECFISQDSQDETSVNNKINNIKSNSDDDILDRLSRLNELANKNIKEKKPVKRKKIKEDISQHKSILSYLIDSDISNNTDLSLVNNNTNDKGTLKEQYLSLTDNMYLCEKVKLSPIKTCSSCNIETTLIHSEGIYVCQNCGKFEYLVIESEIPSHKDALNEKPKYPYKTINHLIERLNQFQGKQTTLIPQDIYNLIRFELKKMQISNDELDPQIIKKILKKYRLNTYYEHCFLIFSHITNIPPPSLTREEEEKVKMMFRQTENPFKKFKPGDRANYLNYSYVLHKLFLILADTTDNEEVCNRMYNNTKYFSLLKSRDKLRMQDLIWKNICKDLNWPYHPSF